MLACKLSNYSSKTVDAFKKNYDQSGAQLLSNIIIPYIVLEHKKGYGDL